MCAYALFAFYEACALSDASGTYALSELPAEEYLVEFYVPPGSGLNYVAQLYGAGSSGVQPPPLVVREAEVVSGIDAALLTGGTLSGKVTDSEAAPIAGIEVCAFDIHGFSASCASTDAEGKYTVAGLASGEYEVEFSAPFEGSQLNYVTQLYKGASTPAEAEPVPVTAGAATSGVDATLAIGGEISGTVTSAATKSAVPGITVCAYDEKSGYQRCATTGEAGAYTVSGLAGGNYKVQFAVPFSSSLNYATQYYSGKARPREAKAVAVVEAATTSGINAALLAGGQITGTVRSAATGDPLEGIDVCALAFEAEGELLLRCAVTGGGGGYRITTLATAGYEVEFFSAGQFAPLLYEEGGQVSVEAGRTVEHVDAWLKLSVPRDLIAPSISGSAALGQTLSAIHGSWTNHPTGYVDQWGRCESSGKGCFTIATGPNYVVAPADAGRRIGLREAAFNAGGSGAFAYSALTSVVPPPGPGSGAAVGSGGATVPALPPASGALGSTSTAASLAQLKALLGRLLVPVGKGAKIGALLRHGGYVLSFRALAAGRLAISWYLLPKGAHLATAKPILVASGRVGMAASGAARIKIKLTSRGRVLLARARRVRLTAAGTLSASGQSTASSRRAFTLKR